ncbi:hypothetical protein BJX66DRAFT_320930 [Aspergillus keveii]|uniref:Uncharacterized protein n=1 Tax=Aspergillus keveii TaxID=714993 RepID=A0ABR4FGJ4_9EURO
MSHAAIRVTRMMRTFRSIKFVLSVGVGSGAPTVPNTGDLALDIRLGDVVVGCSDGHNGGVVRYERDPSNDDGLQIMLHSTKSLNWLDAKVKTL